MSTNSILATTPLVSTNYLLRATGTTIGNSLIWDNGTNVGIGNTNTSYTLDVTGTGRFTSSLTATQFIGTSQVILNTSGITTGSVYQRMSNSGQTTYFGIESSVGGDIITGSTAYASVIGTGQSKSFQIGTNDAIRLTISSAGAVTISAPTSGIALTSTGISGQYAAYFQGNTTASNSYGIIISGGTNSSDSALIVRNASNGTTFLTIRGDGVLFSPPTYTNAYASTANVIVGSDGNFGRNTSSLKYKKNVENYTRGLFDVLKLRAVLYESKNPSEEGMSFTGFIAEEVEELGFTEFVEYAEDGTPDALRYPHFTALLVKAIQELSAKNEELSNRLIKLESK